MVGVYRHLAIVVAWSFIVVAMAAGPGRDAEVRASDRDAPAQLAPRTVEARGGAGRPRATPTSVKRRASPGLRTPALAASLAGTFERWRHVAIVEFAAPPHARPVAPARVARARGPPPA